MAKREYFRKWKRDPIFRRNVLIGIIILIFLGNIPETPIEPQATVEECNAWNTEAGWIFSSSDYTSCEVNDCVAVYNKDPGGLGLISGFVNVVDWLTDNIFGFKIQLVSCKPSAKPGQYVFAESMAEANTKCSSGESAEVRSYIGDNLFTCKSGSGCKSWMKPISGVIDGIWKRNKMTCSGKAYLGIFAGGAILLAVI